MVESVKELRKICYKDSGKKRPLYMELVTMKFSIYVTKLSLYTPIGADQVSMLMILLTFIGAGMIAFGNLWWMLAGILIAHFTIVLDNVNGEVARYRKEGSLIGTYLEEVYHSVAEPLVFFAFGYGIFRNTGWESAILFGFICSLFVPPIIISSIKNAVVKKGIDRLESREGMLPKKYTLLNEKINLKGGSTRAGSKFYALYGKINELWGFPFNFVHINIIIALEIINLSYSVIPEFYLSFGYIAAYGTANFIIQIASFIVHYKGRTIFHYYNALFGNKK